MIINRSPDGRLNAIKLDQGVNRLKSRIIQITDTRAIKEAYQTLGKLPISEPRAPDLETNQNIAPVLATLIQSSPYTEPLYKVIEEFAKTLAATARATDPNCEHVELRHYVKQLLMDWHAADVRYAVAFAEKVEEVYPTEEGIFAKIARMEKLPLPSVT